MQVHISPEEVQRPIGCPAEEGPLGYVVRIDGTTMLSTKAEAEHAPFAHAFVEMTNTRDDVWQVVDGSPICSFSGNEWKIIGYMYV